MASPATGVVTNYNTSGPSCEVGGVALSPLPPAVNLLVLAAWGANPKKEISVYFTGGPPSTDPIVVTNATGA